MNVDIRIPIGGMFSAIGVILVVYGLVTFGNDQLYERSLGLNVNLWWGLAMLAFGLIMLFLGRKGTSAPRIGQSPPEPGAPPQRPA